MDNKLFSLRWINMFLIVFVTISVITTLFANNQNTIAQYSFSFSIPRGQQPIPAPKDVAVDESGNIYIATDENVIKLDITGSIVMVLGSEGVGGVQFSNPKAIELDSSGNIYVVDAERYGPSNPCVQKFDSQGNFVSKFGTPGDGDGQFDGPEDIALDSADNIYVTDSGNRRVQKFDSQGKFVSKFGTRGLDDGQFSHPSGIALDNSGNIYVVDGLDGRFLAGRVQKFDALGNFISKVGHPPPDGTDSYSIVGIELDSVGNIYITIRSSSYDYYDDLIQYDRVEKYDSDGNLVLEIGTHGLGNGQFAFDPRKGMGGIALDNSGNIYVADGDRVQKFDALGNFISKIVGTRGTGDGEFSGPAGIALDSTGNIYVVDGDRVQKFDSQGIFISKFDSYGFGDGESESPRGIALDSSGNIYVTFGEDYCHDCDPYNIDVSIPSVGKFDALGNFILRFGTPGDGDGQFDVLNGIALDNSDNIYVTDKYNQRVQKFDSQGNFISKFDVHNCDWYDGPEYIALDSSGNIYVIESGGVYKYDSQGNFVLQYGTNSGYALGIALDSSDNIYVSEGVYKYDQNRVQKYDSEGNFVSQFGSYGFREGQFSRPAGIAVDSSGNIFVVDTHNFRVQVFKPEIVVDNNFSDLVSGGTTSGTIIDSGDQNLTITDEPNPDGVRIVADNSGGPKNAIVSVCGNKSIIKLDAGDEVIVTCGSTNVVVINGIVETIFTLAEGFTATCNLEQGNGITFEPETFMIIAPSDNTNIVGVDIETNGKESSLDIDSGQTLDLLVNKLVAQESAPVTVSNSKPAADAPAGTFTITATFTNISARTINYPLFVVSELSGGNLLLNAEGRPGSVGATLRPNVDNDVLVPGESMTVEFIIGLQDNAKFTFFIDLLGVPES